VTASIPANPELERDEIRGAAARIPLAFRHSPQFLHDGLSSTAGLPVIVKVETVNPIGAFKGRGCWLAVSELAREERVGPDRPVIVASTGNFGLGTAYAGRAMGVPVVVFADVHANERKLDRIRALGATVIQAGRDFDEAREAASTHAAGQDGFLLTDGAEPWIATGAGTIGVELTDGVAASHLPEVRTVYIPVGNGALIVGVGAWLRAAAPACRIVGVQSDAAPSMTYSWREGRLIETESASTFAEGIATRVPVPQALAMMVGRVDEMLLVSDDAIRESQAALTLALGVTVEGSAAAAWAGLLADPGRSGPAVILVTGSNT
jgi:threonine dehydratase